jgi:hypothetical protein
MYFNNVNEKFQPEIEGLNNNYTDFVNSIYQSTIFIDKEKVLEAINGSKEDVKALSEDPVYKLYSDFREVVNEKVYSVYDSLDLKANQLYRTYMKGLMEMQEDEILFPDANFTMRVSYGEVKGSVPRDGIIYKYYTTLDGVIEKDNPKIYDYDVPDRLKELYESKDYGRYEVDGTVPVCFIATNHTTGGNSGSPVLDAEGNLIGLNFDRMWEGIMSDMVFDPDHSRNITLDIRYVLFIIDKFAGADHLIEEMKIIE